MDVNAIRELKETDSAHMHEWMQDDEVIRYLQTDFKSFTMEDTRKFIETNKTVDFQGKNIHYAIVDEQDEYMGTVSLKNIDFHNRNAEYAITTRKCAHGRGYARMATEDILKIAFEKLSLEKVYLYVSTRNIAANKFYKKVGFVEEGVFKKHLCISGELHDIVWYRLLKEERM